MGRGPSPCKTNVEWIEQKENDKTGQLRGSEVQRLRESHWSLYLLTHHNHIFLSYRHVHHRTRLCPSRTLRRRFAADQI